MKQPSSRTTRVAKIAVLPTAMIISGLVVGQASYAAFSSKTSNDGNSWAAGTVNLTDDDNGQAMFEVKDLKPGQTGTKCLTVTSHGTLPADVRLYATGASATKGLDAQIDLKIDESASCDAEAKTSVFAGTLAEFTGSAQGFNTGVSKWQTAGQPGESKAYTVTYTLNAGVTNDSQGGTAATNFVWEAQNS